MSDSTNPTFQGLRRLTAKYDEAGEGIDDFLLRQMRGENPDPAEFTKLLEKRGVAQDAIQAQFGLYEKPMKSVLNETK